MGSYKNKKRFCWNFKNGDFWTDTKNYIGLGNLHPGLDSEITGCYTPPRNGFGSGPGAVSHVHKGLDAHTKMATKRKGNKTKVAGETGNNIICLGWVGFRGGHGLVLRAEAAEGQNPRLGCAQAQTGHAPSPVRFVCACESIGGGRPTRGCCPPFYSVADPEFSPKSAGGIFSREWTIWPGVARTNGARPGNCGQKEIPGFPGFGRGGGHDSHNKKKKKKTLAARIGAVKENFVAIAKKKIAKKTYQKISDNRNTNRNTSLRFPPPPPVTE